MKKSLLSLSAAMLAGISMASVPNQLVLNQGLTNPEIDRVTSQKLQTKRGSLSKMLQNPAAQQRMRAAANSGKARISTESGPIYDKPAGTETLYSRDSYGFYVYWFYIMFGEQTGLVADIVYGDDGYAYIHNPFAGWTTDSYLKCEVKGDKLVATLPQAIYQEEDYEDPSIIVDYYATILYKTVDEEGNIDYVMSDTDEIKTISWTIDGDNLTMDMEYDTTPDEEGYLQYPEVMFGMVNADGVWTVAGDCAQSYTKVDYKLVEAPEGLEMSEWNLITNGYGTPIQIGFDGNDVYLKGISSTFPDSYVKGTVANGKAVFDSKQYVGIYYGSNFIHFMGGTYDSTGYYLADNITFSYDADNKTMTTEQGVCMMLNGATDRVYYLNMFEDPVIKAPNPNADPTPSAPIPTSYLDYFDDYGCTYFDVMLPNLNDKGEVIDTSNIYYQIYIDGDLFTFYPDEYGIEEEMTDIPYDFSDGDGIYILDSEREITFYFTGYTTIGVRMFNVVDGKTYPSLLTTLNVEDMSYTIEDPVSVESAIADKTPAAVEYYNIQGLKVSNPENGIFVCKKIFEDGSSKVSKVVVK